MVVFRQKSNVSTAKDARDAKERQELKQGCNVKNAGGCVLAAGENIEVHILFASGFPLRPWRPWR
jgi:hypothetical protein